MASIQNQITRFKVECFKTALVTSVSNVILACKFRKIDWISATLIGSLFAVVSRGTMMTLTYISQSLPSEYQQAGDLKNYISTGLLIGSFFISILLTSLLSMQLCSLLGRTVFFVDALSLTCIDSLAIYEYKKNQTFFSNLIT